MNGKGSTATLILMFMPVYFAVASVIFQFNIIDLLYLLVVFVVVIKYYICKKKG